jgi:hypothetical protein
VLQRARAPQKLDSAALKDAQIMRDRTNRRLTARIRDAQDLSELRIILKQYEGEDLTVRCIWGTWLGTTTSCGFDNHNQ